MCLSDVSGMHRAGVCTATVTKCRKGTGQLRLNDTSMYWGKWFGTLCWRTKSGYFDFCLLLNACCCLVFINNLDYMLAQYS